VKAVTLAEVKRDITLRRSKYLAQPCSGDMVTQWAKEHGVSSSVPDTPPSGSNVVDLNAASGRAEAVTRVPPGRLLGVIRGIAAKRIGALATTLFDRVDDALFDMAERAGSNQNQARFFDGMREIRKKRQPAEAAFGDALNRYLQEFEAGKLQPNADEVLAQPRTSGSETLALVEESELEESLAVTAMVDKADTRLSRPLYALSQRFALLVDNKKVDQANNPLGPRLLCQSFAAATREIDIDLAVRLIVLKLFERHVLADLEPVYEEINALLVQAGILPQLRYAVPGAGRRGGGGGGPARAPGAAAGTAPTEGTPTVGPGGADGGGGSGGGGGGAGSDDYGAGEGQPVYAHSDNEIASLVGELRALLASRRGPAVPMVAGEGGYAGSGGGGGVARAPSAQELLNALSLMQSELQTQFAALPVAPGVPVAAGGQVKDDLLTQIQRLGGSPVRPTHLGADEDTIDLVGMVFEYALQDRNLPAPMQALLGRLQIPYLKVALLDREFVSHKSHPARRLLDTLAQACVGWTEENDKDQRLYTKVHDIVTTLLKEFDDNLDVFDRLLNEFNEFGDKTRKRAELVERRTTEAARGREKLETAQRAAARSILSRVSGHSLPNTVRDLLTRRWSNYLVLTYLRHGEESSEWRSAEKFVEAFTWSVEPKPDVEQRERLRRLIPDIERMLRHGLTATGFHEGHFDELWEEIKQIYDALLDDTPKPAAAPANDPLDGDSQDPVAQGDEPGAFDEPEPPEGLTIRFASSRAGEEVVFKDEAETEFDQDADITEETLEQWLRVARALKTGTWVEFVRDDGSRERAKLLWVSTIRALYLFVNRNGLKIAEKTANELASELRDQRAVILEQVALVDRALDAILRRLRGTPKPPEGFEESPA
jgi:hypothetical protein